MISDEGQMQAARVMRDAADKTMRAAEIMDEASRALRVLLEDGYGGNGLLLLEALRSAALDKDAK